MGPVSGDRGPPDYHVDEETIRDLSYGELRFCMRATHGEDMIFQGSFPRQAGLDRTTFQGTEKGKRRHCQVMVRRPPLCPRLDNPIARQIPNMSSDGRPGNPEVCSKLPPCHSGVLVQEQDDLPGCCTTEVMVETLGAGWVESTVHEVPDGAGAGEEGDLLFPCKGKEVVTESVDIHAHIFCKRWGIHAGIFCDCAVHAITGSTFEDVLLVYSLVTQCR